jgi:hypothetical protein
MTYDPQLLTEHEGHFYALVPDPESGLPTLLALPVATEHDDQPAHPSQHPDPYREGWYDPLDLEPAVRESLVRRLTTPPAGSLPPAYPGEHGRVLDAMAGEDTFTTTVEGAAAFERHRAISAGEYPDPPDPADWRDEPVSETEAARDGWRWLDDHGDDGDDD